MVSIVIVTIGNPKYIWVPARAELKLELEPHLEVRQNAVAPVAGAEEDLRGSVTLLHTAFSPAQLRSAAKVRELMQDLEVQQPELGCVVQPRNHLQV